MVEKADTQFLNIDPSPDGFRHAQGYFPGSPGLKYGNLSHHHSSDEQQQYAEQKNSRYFAEPFNTPSNLEMERTQPIYILGIETSCDDTGAAVLAGDKLLANIVASQDVHRKWGGVVPELASRTHQQNMVPVVDAALHEAKIDKAALHAVAYTRGPGLPGSLLVGSAFAKGFAAALNLPLIGVNHMEGHVLAHLIDSGKPRPEFPFLCLTVSGGHTQIVLVEAPLRMTVLGETTDDAVGEAFDKSAKLLGLPYPGGPWVDRLAAGGNPEAFRFPKPKVPGLDFSFSGIKTAFMLKLKEGLAEHPDFVENRKADLCASLQKTLIEILLEKLLQASREYGIKTLALAGGVSANSGLRNAFESLVTKGYRVFIPPFAFCTDNAAMIAIAGYYAFLEGKTEDLGQAPQARMPIARTERTI